MTIRHISTIPMVCVQILLLGNIICTIILKIVLQGCPCSTVFGIMEQICFPREKFEYRPWVLLKCYVLDKCNNMDNLEVVGPLNNEEGAVDRVDCYELHKGGVDL